MTRAAMEGPPYSPEAVAEARANPVVNPFLRVLYHPIPMRLYGGGTSAVRRPDIPESSRNLDFGRGFYTTSSEDQARRWAEKVSQARNGPAILNHYGFDDTEAFRSLEVIRFERPTVEWLDFIISNRRGICEQEYDMAIGPVANDTIYATLAGYDAGIYTKEEAVSRLRPEALHDQYLFHTPESLEFLVFEGSRSI